MFPRCKKNLLQLFMTCSSLVDYIFHEWKCSIYLFLSTWLILPVILLISNIKPCINVHGQYNGNVGSSLKQLGLLWSRDYRNWIAISYTNHYLNLFFVFKFCFVSTCYTMSLSVLLTALLIFCLISYLLQ